MYQFVNNKSVQVVYTHSNFVSKNETFLFTGREFFVGISEWTNEAGARAVAAAFPEYPCTPIKVKYCFNGILLV